MKEALKEKLRSLPSDTKPPEMLEPCDRSLYLPPASVAPQWAAVLSLVLGATIGTVGSDHFAAQLLHLGVESVAVVRLVADDPRRDLGRKHEVKHLLHELALVSVRRSRVDRHRQAPGIDQHHDFHAFSDLRASNAVSSALGLAERRIDEALVEVVTTPFLDAPTRVAHDGFKHTRLDPVLEPSVHRTLGTELPRQILPLRTAIEDPEDACDHLALVGRRPAPKWAARWVRNAVTDPIQLVVRES